jgi:hypothetical protein
MLSVETGSEEMIQKEKNHNFLHKNFGSVILLILLMKEIVNLYSHCPLYIMGTICRA